MLEKRIIPMLQAAPVAKGLHAYRISSEMKGTMKTRMVPRLGDRDHLNVLEQVLFLASWAS